MRKKKEIIGSIVAGVLIVTLSIGATLAYFSYSTDVTNTFVTGHVEIILEEPNYSTTDADEDGVPDESELLIPYEEITKDPTITNTGDNAAIVFIKLTSPAELISVIESGTKYDAAITDIFFYKQSTDSEDTHANNFDENWIELTELEHCSSTDYVTNVSIAGETTNDEAYAYEYVFGYYEILEVGETTSALFDKIQAKKFGSTTMTSLEVESIIIEGYAIQSDDIYDETGIEIDSTKTLDEDTLTYIYTVFFNQNEETNLTYSS